MELPLNYFKKALEVYFGAGANLNRKGFWFKLWLFCKGRAYRNRRRRILFNQAKVVGKIRFKETLMHPNPLLDLVPKGESFVGTKMYVPFLKEGEK